MSAEILEFSRAAEPLLCAEPDALGRMGSIARPQIKS
jgi:hypothetical protein